MSPDNHDMELENDNTELENPPTTTPEASNALVIPLMTSGYNTSLQLIARIFFFGFKLVGDNLDLQEICMPSLCYQQ